MLPPTHTHTHPCGTVYAPLVDGFGAAVSKQGQGASRERMSALSSTPLKNSIGLFGAEGLNSMELSLSASCKASAKQELRLLVSKLGHQVTCLSGCQCALEAAVPLLSSARDSIPAVFLSTRESGK